jgi:hypothetical protein
MRNTLLDILILGLLVLLFGVIYRKRATARLRFWIAGWLFTLAHFAMLLLSPATPFWQEMQIALAMGGLVMAGVCFILASSAFALPRKDLLLLAAVITAPSLVYISLVFFGYSAVWPLKTNHFVDKQHCGSRVWRVARLSYPFGTGGRRCLLYPHSIVPGQCSSILERLSSYFCRCAHLFFRTSSLGCCFPHSAYARAFPSKFPGSAGIVECAKILC